MVIEMTRERRLRRLWLFSGFMMIVSLVIFAIVPRVISPEGIFIAAHGIGWGLLSGMAHADLIRLKLTENLKHN